MAGYTVRKVRLVSAYILLAEGHILRACVPPLGWMGDGGGGITREGDANEHAYVCALPPTASTRKFHPYSHGVVVFIDSIPAWWLGERERALIADKEEALAEPWGGGARIWRLHLPEAVCPAYTADQVPLGRA